MATTTKWEPQPGPQTAAYNSAASIIGYGGAAGGGKTDLLLGFAGKKHRRSIIFRRVFPSLRGIVERSREIYNANASSHAKDSYNESLHVWRLADGRMVEFGAVQYDTDKKKHQGQARDFFGFDEATEFPELLIRFLIGWNRTTVPGQECRVVLTFNPPMDDSGNWIIDFFGPWLNPKHPNPAKDGELRWYAMIDGKETEVGPEPFEHKGEIITPKSRTFFHATLKDNPILAASGYGATIDAMPEPLRSILRGSFNTARMADPWQVIPTAWVKAAQERWKARTPPTTPLTALGVDVAHGGDDQTVLARRYDNYFAALEKHPGITTQTGHASARLVFLALADDPDVVPSIDAIGYGASCVDVLRGLDIAVNAVNVSEASTARDKSGKLGFVNQRAELFWKLREALDPESGQDIALPDDPELLADLCGARWQVNTRGIQVESKDDIKARLHRSPDCGDAVLFAMITPRQVLWGFG